MQYIVIYTNKKQNPLDIMKCAIGFYSKKDKIRSYYNTVNNVNPKKYTQNLILSRYVKSQLHYYGFRTKILSMNEI